MVEQPDQQARDAWQTRLYEASHRYAVCLKELHATNPWPELPALENAISTLATELWDYCFSQTEIKTALHGAVADLPGYTAGNEFRPGCPRPDLSS